MRTRINYDITTGETTEVPVTDEWLLATFPVQYMLTPALSAIDADGEDTAVISVQRKTVKLLDGSRNDILGAGFILIGVEGNYESVELDANGAGQYEVVSSFPGTFVIRCEESFASNEVTVEAT